MRTRDLVEFGLQVVFRHPLVRFVVYHSTPFSQQRRIHRGWRLRVTRASIRIGSRGIRGWLRASLMTRWRASSALPPSSWLSRTGAQRFLARYLTVARQLATGDLLPQDYRELGIDRHGRSKVEP